MKRMPFKLDPAASRTNLWPSVRYGFRQNTDYWCGL